MFIKSVKVSKTDNPFDASHSTSDKIIQDRKRLSAFPIEDLLINLDPNKSYDFILNVGSALWLYGFPFDSWKSWAKTSDRYKQDEIWYSDEWEAFQAYKAMDFGWLIERASKEGYLIPDEYKQLLFQNIIKYNYAAIHMSELALLPRRKYLCTSSEYFGHRA